MLRSSNVQSVDARDARRLTLFGVDINMQLSETPAVAAMPVVHLGYLSEVRGTSSMRN